MGFLKVFSQGMQDGFLNLNKPVGLTSHDCVARVRRVLHLKRVGHGGTLDPAATGVLPIALGRATRLLQFLSSGKQYRATIRLGVRTATDDLEGEILTAAPVAELELATVEAALATFQGTIEQIPPSYSAIQVQGKRLYSLARAGEQVKAPARLVEVHHIEVLNWRPGDFPEIEVAIACSPGTYIRAIARDLGEQLQTGATLAALVRTASGGFSLDTSLTLDEFTQQVQDWTFRAIAPEIALAHLPAITLLASDTQRWSQGQRIILTDPLIPTTSRIYRVHHPDGSFLGLGEHLNSQQGQLLVPKLVFTS